jgi:hypothetical protein
MLLLLLILRECRRKKEQTLHNYIYIHIKTNSTITIVFCRKLCKPNDDADYADDDVIYVCCLMCLSSCELAQPLCTGDARVHDVPAPV